MKIDTNGIIFPHEDENLSTPQLISKGFILVVLILFFVTFIYGTYLLLWKIFSTIGITTTDTSGLIFSIIALILALFIMYKIVTFTDSITTIFSIPWLFAPLLTIAGYGILQLLLIGTDSTLSSILTIVFVGTMGICLYYSARY